MGIGSMKMSRLKNKEQIMCFGKRKVPFESVGVLQMAVRGVEVLEHPLIAIFLFSLLSRLNAPLWGNLCLPLSRLEFRVREAPVGLKLRQQHI